MGQTRLAADGEAVSLAETESGIEARGRRKTGGTGGKTPRDAAGGAAVAAATFARAARQVAGAHGQRTAPVAGETDSVLARPFLHQRSQCAVLLLFVFAEGNL